MTFYLIFQSSQGLEHITSLLINQIKMNIKDGYTMFLLLISGGELQVSAHIGTTFLFLCVSIFQIYSHFALR